MTHTSTEQQRAGRYTKKPVTIEAVQFGRRFDWPQWFHDAVSVNKVFVYGTGKHADPREECFAMIHTLEGVMRVSNGDWIIRGVKGELYPCKPDVFAATYEPEQAARRAPVVPQEWKITEEMHIAAVKVLHRASGVDGLPQRMVDAMLAAAPQPPEIQPNVCKTEIQTKGCIEAAPVQMPEPAAWMFPDRTWTEIRAMGVDHCGEPAYTEQQVRQLLAVRERKPLSEADAMDIAEECASGALLRDFVDAVRATERAHGITGGVA